MVISADEKKILLERLQKARETKAAKALAKKKETPASVKEPEPPAPAPAPVPAPAPAPVPEPPAPEPTPPVVPDVPDLVAMSRKKPAKKKCLPPVSSDEDSDEEEAELPPKKGKGGKKQAYMKIKIYKEPKNAVAFQSLVEAIQDEQPDPEPEHPSPPASNSIGRSCKFDIKNKTKPEGRSLPTPQELMRRAALEFFS